MRGRFAACSIVFACAVWASGCGNSNHPPTARATASPMYLPLNDDYATDVLLDGSASDDAIDDPGAAHPLSFVWSIDDPAPRVTAGALDAPTVTVRLAAARPTTVQLMVSDQDGDSSTVTIHV